jgi:uncharacterized protein YodC (DUF2158 family)
MEAGSVVRLKSGGPNMTVAHPGLPSACSVWCGGNHRMLDERLQRHFG